MARWQPPEGPAARWAYALGYAGLLPFFALALLVWLLPGDAKTRAALAIAAYGALIASFLGGIHWGAVWARGEALAPALRQRLLLWGVMPSLLAWPGLLMPARVGLAWLGLLLLACYAVDRRLFPLIGIEAWLTLRLRLSTLAALACFIAAGAL